jgi:hypothetical protein
VAENVIAEPRGDRIARFFVPLAPPVVGEAMVAKRRTTRSPDIPHRMSVALIQCRPHGKWETQFPGSGTGITPVCFLTGSLPKRSCLNKVCNGRFTSFTAVPRFQPQKQNCHLDPEVVWNIRWNFKTFRM